MNDQSEQFTNAVAMMAEHTDAILDQIRKLAGLREEGLLTDEEFAAKKMELLSRL